MISRKKEIEKNERETKNQIEKENKLKLIQLTLINFFCERKECDTLS